MACVAVAVDTAAAGLPGPQPRPPAPRARRRADRAAPRLARGARRARRRGLRPGAPARAGAGGAAGSSPVRTPPRRGSGPNRSGCGSRCTSRRSPAARRPSRPGSARSPRRPRRRASTRSTRWTTSARSRRSDGRGTTSSRASPRSPGWRRARRGCGSARSSRASPIATSGTSRRSSPPWTCCPVAERCAASGWAWFAAEHRAYGWPFPPVKERYALLEDALAALPVLWGPGGKPFRSEARGSVHKRKLKLNIRAKFSSGKRLFSQNSHPSDDHRAPWLFGGLVFHGTDGRIVGHNSR